MLLYLWSALCIVRVCSRVQGKYFGKELKGPIVGRCSWHTLMDRDVVRSLEASDLTHNLEVRVTLEIKFWNFYITSGMS